MIRSSLSLANPSKYRTKSDSSGKRIGQLSMATTSLIRVGDSKASVNAVLAPLKINGLDIQLYHMGHEC